jgi:hypothetical protein
MAVALPISPELVLVAPPEEAAHARALLPDPVDLRHEPAPAAAVVAEGEHGGSALGAAAVIVYSGLLLAAVMFVLVAIVVHEIRFAGGL